MKHIFIFLLIFISACNSTSNRGKNENNQNVNVDKTTSKSDLAGKVYISSVGVDSGCKIIPSATDFFEEIIFINDTSFVQAIYTCCGDEGEEFAYEFYVNGTYQLTDKELILNLSPYEIVKYSKAVADPKKPEQTISQDRLAKEKNKIIQNIYSRMSCENVLYFKLKEGNFADDVICLSSETIDKKIAYLKNEGIFPLLFPQK